MGEQITGTWYVKLPGATTLAEREIIEITEETVLLQNNGTVSRYNKARYKTSDVEFIEAF